MNFITANPRMLAGPTRQRIAVVGSGISGTSVAWALSGTHDVTLFEQDARPGGHTATVDIDYDGKPIAVDTGFIVFNELNYPNLTALFETLDVKTHDSDMSFALSLDEGRMEWSGDSLDTVFACRRNLVTPSFLIMLREVFRFNSQCVADRAARVTDGLTIGEYLEFRRFSASFRDNYLVPLSAAIWSTPGGSILDFPADTFITFFDNHRLIHRERPQWRTVTGGSRSYHERMLDDIGRSNLRLGDAVVSVIRATNGVLVKTASGRIDGFDQIVLAGHTDQMLSVLEAPTAEEKAILGAIAYEPNRVVLHRDTSLMPRRRKVWASWNYTRDSSGAHDAKVAVTYWMNRLQGIDPDCPLFVTLNPHREPEPSKVFGEWTYSHPQFDKAALAAQQALPAIQGANNTWYAGAWTGFGFHEDGIRSGLDVAERLGGIVPWRESERGSSNMAVAAE